MARSRSNRRKSSGKLKRKPAGKPMQKCKLMPVDPSNVRVLRNKKQIVINNKAQNQSEGRHILYEEGSDSNIQVTFNAMALNDVISIDDSCVETPLSENTLKVNVPVLQQNVSNTRLPEHTERVVSYKSGDDLNISVTCNIVASTTKLSESASEIALPKSISGIDISDEHTDAINMALPEENPISKRGVNGNHADGPHVLDHITIVDESNTTIPTSPPNTPLANNIICDNQKTTSRDTAIDNINEMSTVATQKTLNDVHQTIDVAGSDSDNDDVILITDCDKSNIIMSHTPIRKKRRKKKKLDNSYIIVIEDDSITEIPNPSVLRSNKRKRIKRNTNKSLLLSHLDNGNVQNKLIKAVGPVTSTPVHSTGNTAQSKANALTVQAALSPIPVKNTAPNSAQNRSKVVTLRTQALQVQKEVFGISNVIGRNFLNANSLRLNGLRPIFIDGSNVAIGHSNGKCFSVKGLKICIDYFRIRGHEVAAIVPQYRKEHSQTSDPRLLNVLEKEGVIIFTPSRKVNGRCIVPYDDRYIVLLAHVNQGIIVSADNYRDLLLENPDWLDTIQNRILTPTWMKDMIMFPTDPLGRTGPKLDEFLKFPE